MILATLTVEVTAQQWPELRQEAKAGARWWWLGSAVDKENLRWTMQEYANHRCPGDYAHLWGAG